MRGLLWGLFSSSGVQRFVSLRRKELNARFPRLLGAILQAAKI